VQHGSGVKMPGFQNHAGINLTSAKMQLVEVNYSDEEFIVENADEEYFSEFLDLNAKETKVLATLQGAFDELVMRRPLKSKLVSFTLPNSLFHVVRLPYENTLVQDDMLEEFKWELSNLFPKSSREEMVVQSIKVEDNKKTFSSAIVVATYRKYLKLLNNFCLKNGLKLKYVDNVHIASDRLISLGNSPSDREVILSVYIAGEALSVTFLFRGKPIYFDIVQLSNAGEILTRLSEELEAGKSIKINPASISKAFISGDNIPDSLLEKAAKSLSIDFIRFNPFEELKVNPDLFESRAFTEKANSFSPAAAIAFRLV
jgi:Tfp pilus assembly PilM family ATPase